MLPLVLGGLIAGAASLVGNVVGSLVNTNSQRTQTDLANDTNRDIAASNNETAMNIASQNLQMQKEENRLNRQFNSLEADKAYQRELEKMRQSYEYQVQLNSPVEMVKRLREAGLNPALAYGDAGSMGSVSGGSAPSASYNTGLTPQLPSLASPTIQPGPAFPNIATGVLDGMVKLQQIQLMRSQSGNLDAETQTLYDTLEEKIRSLQLSNNAQDDINKLRQAFEPFERMLGLSEKWSQIELFTQEAYEAASQGRLNDALKAKADADKILSDAAAKVKGKEGELLDKQIQWYDKSQTANINNLNARSRESNANADYTAEKIATEPSVRLKVASEALDAWQSYNAHKLSPQDMDKLREVASKKLEDEAIRQKGNSNWNPLLWLATIVHPLAEEIGIALGGTASYSNKPAPVVKKHP